MVKVKFFITAMLSVSLLAGCSSTKVSKNSDDPGKIQIVAAENFYGEVAKAVGGDLVEVISILNRPDMDPHDFEPTPQV
jgi:zinc/manganese transport system substrate-binding protein